MDDTVNSFLKEINEIIPPKHTNTENVWKECFDKQSGFPYYWNSHTDEVTWEMPDELKSKQQKKSGLYIPPKTLPGSSIPVPTESVKIYKIESENTKPVYLPKTTVQKKISETKPSAVKKPFISGVDSDDEKITLISSYGGDTDSETEEESNAKTAPQQKIKTETENDILKKLQNKASETKVTNVQKVEPKKEISGFKLVAGYSSDEDDDDNEENSENEFEKVSNDKKPCSTLFPIQERVSLEQLKPLEENVTPVVVENETIDTKLFQRKRKIDIDVVNAQNLPPKQTKTIENTEHAGFGYNKSNYTDYLGFKSGGVMFVKSEETELTKQSTNIEEDSSKEVIKEKVNSVEFEETKSTLCEKLAFLSEGRPTVSPVQTMIIQVETLYTAVKHGSLNTKYFNDWLNDTCTDLIKLEQEAAPTGWLLQWDRLNKRYFYQNKSTGESQWEYPQPDVIRCDEAMDISTTPPPPPDDEDDDNETKAGPKQHPEAPPPPKIGNCKPVPPPPPIISTKQDKTKTSGTISPVQESIVNESNEPLPPGVDALEQVEVPVANADNLNSVLSSFYSEISTITSATTVTEVTNPVITEESSSSSSGKPVDGTVDKVKKKKKAKVKIAQGLAMKKKGVSSLVEKWKKVQNNY